MAVTTTFAERECKDGRRQGSAVPAFSLSVTSLSVVSSPGWAGAASIFSEQLCVTGPARAELLLVWSRS